MNLRNCSSVLFSSLLFFSSYIYLYVRISFPTSSPWLFSSPLFCSSFAIDASGRTSGRCAGVLLFLRMLWGTRVQRHRLKHVGAARKIWENEFSSPTHVHTHLWKFSLSHFLLPTQASTLDILMESRAQFFLFTISLHLFFNTLYI